MSLGERIAEKRKEKNFSQETLGKSLGVTASFVSQIEKGIRNPTYSLLLKISHELDVPLDFLIGGEVKGINDPTGKIIASALRFLDPSIKGKLLEHVYLLTGTRKYHDFPFFDSPLEYAQHVLKRYKYNNPPIEPMEVAKSLGVRVVLSKDNLDFEGILYKSSEEPLILLSPDLDYGPRIKFTVAMLLGHLIIPWHLKSVFYREKNKRSLEEDDQLGIEAREFAGALMIPPFMLRKDFKNITPGLESFENLAYNNYGSSMLAIAQSYIKSHGKTSVLITSDKIRYTRKYDAGFPYNLVNEVKQGSYAYSFIDNPPQEKEIRKGIIDSTAWIENPPDGIKIYEESLLDPKFGITVTFLQIKK